MELADVAEAKRCLARNQQLVGDLGQRILTWGVLHQRASLSVLHTDPDAEATVIAARDFCATLGQPDLVFFASGPLYVLYLHQGRLGELNETVHQFADRTSSPTVQALYATLLGETGHRPAAAAIFDRFDANGFAHPTGNVAWLMFITQCAWQCARLGRTGCAPRLRSALEPYADQLVVAGLAGAVGGSVAYYLGLLATAAGDWSAAEAHFTTAAATHQRIEAPGWLARTRVEWSRMLITRAEPGDAKRARDFLGQAVTTARERSLPGIEREAAELLASQQ